MSFITFNTRKKAEHYIKHKNAQYNSFLNGPYHNGEEFQYYTIKNRKVLKVDGWRCGCGCDRGSTYAYVIGKVK